MAPLASILEALATQSVKRRDLCVNNDLSFYWIRGALNTIVDAWPQTHALKDPSVNVCSRI